MRALALFLLIACIGAPDRATLEGGHGWGSGEGDIGGVKAVEEDSETNWVGVGLQFPITYQEHQVDSCRRCEVLGDQVRELRLRASQEPPRDETKAEGVLIGSGSVAALGAILAIMQRLGYVPTIKSRREA